eukprot:scaffold1843_cov143-Skeletonema_menzelii.AAC.10
MSASYRFAALLVAALSTAISAEPMLLLMNAQPKCMSVEAPADARLTIEYEAPDLILPNSKGPDGQPVDPRSFRKYRTTITIEQDDERGYHHGRHDPRRPKNKDSNSKMVRDLEKKKGSLIYDSKFDGKISICVQSLTASAISPTPISLRVYESPDLEGFETVGAGAVAHEAVELDSQSQRNAQEHFSQMERTLSSLISKTDMILRQADYAKELEVEFHDQTIAMNKASQWWPISGKVVTGREGGVGGMVNMV